MKHFKMEILFYFFIILLIKNSSQSVCYNCQNCIEEKSICELCKSGFKTSNSFPASCVECDSTIQGDYFAFDYSTLKCYFADKCPPNGVHYPTSFPKKELYVYDTNECVENCPPDYFLLNKICYKGDCPPDTIKNDTGTNECKCAYKFLVNNDNTVHCYSENEPCPDTNYFTEEDKECLAYSATQADHKFTPPSEDFYVRKIISRGATNYQVLVNCTEDEFLYKPSDATITNQIECVKSCESTSYKYHDFGSNICLSVCDETKYKYEKDKICYNTSVECPSVHNILNSGTGVPNECVDYPFCTDTSATPFEYEPTKTCLDSCKISNPAPKGSQIPDEILIEIIEPSSKDSSKLIRKCVFNCTEQKPFKEEYDTGNHKFRCVEKCGLNGENQFISSSGDQCISQCPNTESYTIDTKRCVPFCGDDYFNNTLEASGGAVADNICYKSCKYLAIRNYHNLTSRQCVDPTDVTNCAFYVEDDPQNLCYESCPSTAPYLNDGTHKCFQSSIGCHDPKNNPVYIYHMINDTYNCIDISKCTHYRTEDFDCLYDDACNDLYPYEYDNICYKKKCPDDTMVFNETVNGTYQCFYLKDCVHYIQDGNCVDECDSINYPYKISNTSLLPGRCFKTIEGCYNLSYIYTQNDTNICDKTCSGYAIQFEPGTFHPYKRDAGTCLYDIPACPPDFPYNYSFVCYKDGCPSGALISKIENGNFTCENACPEERPYIFQEKECVEDCKNTKDIYYIEGTNTKKCLNKCPDDKPFYSAASSKNFSCYAKCQDIGATFLYYDSITKECFESCKNDTDQIKIFAFKATTEALPCLEKCPDGYYYDPNMTNSDFFICVDSCPPEAPYHSLLDNKVCISSCGAGEKYGYNNQCVDKCPDYYYFNSTGIIICTEKCSFTEDGEEFRYLVNSTGECVKNCSAPENFVSDSICSKQCPPDKPYFYDDGHNKICLSACSQSGTNNYTRENDYECLDKCKDPYRFTVYGSYECLLKCPNEYPAQNHYADIDYCSKICLDNKVTQDNLCMDDCSNGGSANWYKPFLDPLTQDCLSSCPSRLPYYKKDASQNFYHCLSYCNASDYALPTGECISSDTGDCPSSHNFIGKGNICKTKCDPDIDGKYYYEIKPNSKVYNCTESCAYVEEKNLTVENDFECINKCPTNHPYRSPLGVCHSICNVNKEYPYTLIDGDSGECVVECNSTYNAYLEDKVCVSRENCITTYHRVVNEFGQCVYQCDQNSNYKFLLDGNCSVSCKDNQYYSLRDYVCVDVCKSPDNYIREGNICASSCDSNSSFPFAEEEILPTGPVVFHCRPECPNGTYYYEGINTCKTTCGDGYNVQYTKKCVLSCRDLDDYYFFEPDSPNEPGSTYQMKTCVKKCVETSKPFTLDSRKCANNCDDSKTHKFYRERDKICLVQCPENYHFNNTGLCMINCEADQFLLPEGNCTDKCDSTSLYTKYIPGENECLKNCPKNYYEYDNNICLTTCNDTKPFAKNGKCEEHCGNDQYYIKSFTHGEIDTLQICLSDCLPEYPYSNWTEVQITGESKRNIYECLGSCPNFYYRVPNKISKNCTDECTGIHPFVGDNNECLSECPKDKPFYIPDNGLKGTSVTAINVFCQERCNDTYPYHFRNNTLECVNECDTDYINYNDGECTVRCGLDEYWVEDKDVNGKTKTFCLHECIPKYGLFSTPENECVDNCSIGNYTANYETRKCECINLYRINEKNGHKICYDSELLSCSNNTDDGYIYLQYGTKKCINVCKTILSPHDECLPTNECPENSIASKLKNGINKCLCQYKFYRDGLEQYVCLGPNDPCPSEYKYYVMETKECTNSCPESQKNIFHNYCLENCPENATNTTGECICDNNWYIEPSKVGVEGQIEFICLTEKDVCTNTFPLAVVIGTEESKQCVNQCSGLNYIYYNEQCLQNCDKVEGSKNIMPFEKNNELRKFANYTCRCDNVWFYEKDSHNINCSQTETTCSKYSNYKYEINETKQCVPECPEDHKYSFNFKCFADCEKEGKAYGLYLKNDDSESKNNIYKCKCVNPWWLNDNNEIICSPEPYCIDKTTKEYNERILLINSTNECFESKSSNIICPENLVKFNGVCYAKDSCPINTQYLTTYAQDCQCVNLWFEIKNSKTNNDKYDKYCLPKEVEECPIDYPYLVNKTRQCFQKECTVINPAYKEINYECYESCPFGTKDATSNKCVCDSLHGYWYEYVKQGRIGLYYKCQLTSCPAEKPVHINDTLECLHSCQDKNDGNVYYSYENLCYKYHSSQQFCPEYTYRNDDLKKCVHRSISDSNVDTLQKMYTYVKEDILYLYTHNVTSSGFLYQRYNVSLQIYGLNKNGNTGSEDKILKNNLSYIDLKNCINKLYESNDLKDNDDIIVVKYDLLNISNKHAINPVEYEFYSSATGKLIDASVCVSYSVILSYPISYISSKYDDYSNGEYKNSFKDIFNRGKDLNKKDSTIDTFNSNNSLYYDICISCEIEGKDLVLKDRINYLYPNLSLCEINCTYQKTDFEQERVYCDCSLKKEFDFNRNYLISYFNFSNSEIDSLQKGPSSAAAMKCISRLEESEAITENGAFFYSAVVFVGQIVLCSVAASVGISSVSSVLNSAFGMKTGGENMLNNNAFEEMRLQDPSSLPQNPPKFNKNQSDLQSDQERLDSIKNINNNEKGGIEFIPQEYVFLFFSNQDKGQCKQYEKSRIPFKINPSTTKLLQRIPNVTYNKGLKGPYREEQNIIEIIEDNKKHDFDKAYLYTRDVNTQENEVLNIRRRNPQQSKKEDQELIKIKKIGNNNYASPYQKHIISNRPKEKISYDTESDDQHTEEEDEAPRKEKDIKNADESLYKEIQREARILRSPYRIAKRYETSNIFVLVLTEICDKVYLLRTLLLTKKYEIFSVKLSLYLLYHILLLTIICLFFDVENIRKIFNDNNFPDIGFYLLYGFISNLIVWFVYKMLKCLISNFKQINHLVRLENEYLKTNNDEMLDLIEMKKKKFMKTTKIKIAIFFSIQFVLVIICGIYLTVFCAVYTGTKKYVFKAYGISIVEIIIIKIIFALILCILRSASLGAKIKTLYAFTRYLETYFN